MQNSDSTQLQLAIVQHTKSNVMQYINDESLKEALVTTKINKDNYNQCIKNISKICQYLINDCKLVLSSEYSFFLFTAIKNSVQKHGVNFKLEHGQSMEYINKFVELTKKKSSILDVVFRYVLSGINLSTEEFPERYFILINRFMSTYLDILDREHKLKQVFVVEPVTMSSDATVLKMPSDADTAQYKKALDQLAEYLKAEKEFQDKLSKSFYDLSPFEEEIKNFVAKQDEKLIEGNDELSVTVENIKKSFEKFFDDLSIKAKLKIDKLNDAGLITEDSRNLFKIYSPYLQLSDKNIIKLEEILRLISNVRSQFASNCQEIYTQTADELDSKYGNYIDSYIALKSSKWCLESNTLSSDDLTGQILNNLMSFIYNLEKASGYVKDLTPNFIKYQVDLDRIYKASFEKLQQNDFTLEVVDTKAFHDLIAKIQEDNKVITEKDLMDNKQMILNVFTQWMPVKFSQYNNLLIKSLNINKLFTEQEIIDKIKSLLDNRNNFDRLKFQIYKDLATAFNNHTETIVTIYGFKIEAYILKKAIFESIFTPAIGDKSDIVSLPGIKEVYAKSIDFIKSINNIMSTCISLTNNNLASYNNDIQNIIQSGFQDGLMQKDLIPDESNFPALRELLQKMRHPQINQNSFVNSIQMQQQENYQGKF